MYKIVINTCYGGFSLSKSAATKLAHLKKVPLNREYPEYQFNHLPRHDADLVQVVNEYGEAASGPNAKLSIIESNDHIYMVEEYDGKENLKTFSLGEDWFDARIPNKE